MVTVKRSRPAGIVLLTFLMAFQAINGFVGGGMLVLDPSGDLLGISVNTLTGSPFANFLLPGLALFALLGVVPLIVTYALWVRPKWGPVALERLTGEHWAWAGALMVGVALLIFLAVELLIVGYTLLLLIMSVVGVGILALTLLPATRGYYARR